MFLKKYEAFLQKLNTQIMSGEFKVEENKEKLEKIIAIYKVLQEKNYPKAKELIHELGFVEEETLKAKRSSQISPGCPPPPSPAPAAGGGAPQERGGVVGSLKNFFSFGERKYEIPTPEKKEYSEGMAEMAGEKMPESEYFGSCDESLNNFRDWNIQTLHDEDNIEAFNSIEMMSAIFLQNLKEQIGTQK